MKQIESKVVIEFTQEEASILGSWIQWVMTPPEHDEVFDILKQLGTLLLPQHEQD